MPFTIENTIFALDALNTNRFRTSLSLLGIVIGVAAVIIIGGISTSGKKIIFNELETFGIKSIWVYRDYNTTAPGKTFRDGTGILTEDIEDIQKQCKDIQYISPVIRDGAKWAKRGNLFAKVNLIAVGTKFDIINNDVLIQGRFIANEDMVHRRPVCIIGNEIKEKLFKWKSPLGEDIYIGRHKYTVVGVLKQKDRDFLSSIGSIGDGQNENTRVIIPVTAYQKQFHTRNVDLIQAQGFDSLNSKDTGRKISDILSLKYKNKYQYEYQTMQQYIETADNILRVVSWIGGMAGTLCIVVGGIGIMNIMIASVLERTKEIGLRKAIGARSRDILYQFIVESTMVTVFGGIVGICIGIVSLSIIELIIQRETEVAGVYIIISISVCLIVGLLSGLYPAARAATMDPVDALKSY